MSRHVSRLLMPLIAIFFAAAILIPRPAPATPSGHAPDELLIGFHAGVSEGEAEGLYRSHGAAKLEKLRGIRVHRMRVAPSSFEETKRKLSRHPAVKFVEPNGVLTPAMVTNDPYFGSAWHLGTIDAPEAWDITTGASSVIIAIVDSGVDKSHPDLAGKLVPGFNTWYNNTDTSDAHGHGTWVSGAAGAIGNNGIGVAGVALRNSLMPVRFFGPNGYGYYSTAASAIVWAADHGAKVINLSVGGVHRSATLLSAAQYARNRGAVVVAAADNCGCYDPTPDSPYVISVSATTSADTIASFSSTGPYVDVAAPGTQVWTTLVGGGYAPAQGTSFASPVVAGVVGLMRSANPSLAPSEIETLLKANTVDLGAAGWDPQFGHGRVNAYRAVAAAARFVTPSDTTSPTVRISSPTGGVTVSGTVAVSVSASDDTGVKRADLYIDGVFLASDTASPFTFAWNSTLVGNGSHTLVARAYDAAGNQGVSAPVSVSVSNTSLTSSSDTTAPTVSITALSTSANGNGNGAKWKLNATATASDNVGVAVVDLYINGKLSATKTATPWAFTVDIRNLPSGSHRAEAVARDRAGNIGRSAPVNFNLIK